MGGHGRRRAPGCGASCRQGGVPPDPLHRLFDRRPPGFGLRPRRPGGEGRAGSGRAGIDLAGHRPPPGGGAGGLEAPALCGAGPGGPGLAPGRAGIRPFQVQLLHHQCRGAGSPPDPVGGRPRRGPGALPPRPRPAADPRDQIECGRNRCDGCRGGSAARTSRPASPRAGAVRYQPLRGPVHPSYSWTRNRSPPAWSATAACPSP